MFKPEPRSLHDARPLSWIWRMFLFDSTMARGLPLLRGKIHLILLYLFPVWVPALVLQCTTWQSCVAVGICIACALLNFTASALLHNLAWNSRAYDLLTKIDYSCIFVMISGSCTTVPVLLMQRMPMIIYLAVQWTATAAGVTTTFLGHYSTKNGGFRSGIYITMGLTNILFTKQVFPLLTSKEAACLTLLAASYIIGAICYGRKAPTLWPGVLGYHELFHSCCLLGAIFTFILNRSVIQRISTVGSTAIGNPAIQ